MFVAPRRWHGHSSKCHEFRRIQPAEALELDLEAPRSLTWPQRGRKHPLGGISSAPDSANPFASRSGRVAQFCAVEPPGFVHSHQTMDVQLEINSWQVVHRRDRRIGLGSGNLSEAVIPVPAAGHEVRNRTSRSPAIFTQRGWLGLPLREVPNKRVGKADAPDLGERILRCPLGR